jgi:hypothetical protein
MALDTCPRAGVVFFAFIPFLAHSRFRCLKKVDSVRWPKLRGIKTKHQQVFFSVKLVNSKNEMDKNIRHEIYSNPNTKVEVLVKTRKSHNNKDWASMLSEADSDHHNLQRPQKKRLPKTKIEKNKKVSHQGTKKIGHVKADGHDFNTDEVDRGQKEAVMTSGGHKFSSRTLQIFLREMRLALKSEDPEAPLSKILTDLEFVAANLDQDQQKPPREDKSYLYDNALLKAESKTVRADNHTLKGHVDKLESQQTGIESEIKAKDKKINDLKGIINRLTTNNNEMLGILTSKADIEDVLNAMKKANKKLQQDWNSEKMKTAKLEANLKMAESEIFRLHRIIE